jgi:pyruvate/oxaloacetate carboxyltransferase
MIAALEDLGYKTDIDIKKVEEISEQFKVTRKKYWPFESDSSERFFKDSLRLLKNKTQD